MMKIKHYAHALVMLGVFLAALAAYSAWYAYVGKESASALSLANDIQAKQQSAARVQESKTALDRALSDEASIKGYFVNTSDVVPFLESLQNTGAKFGAKVEVVSVSSEPAKPHAVLALSLSITGPFDSVMRTLGAIEYQPYDTTTTNLTLDTTDGAKGAARQWTAAVTVRVGTIDTPALPPPLSPTSPTGVPGSTTQASTSTTTP